MTIKHIVISYDDATADNGIGQLDLYAYLLNEFDNQGIKTTILESDQGLSFTCEEFAERFGDNS